MARLPGRDLVVLPLEPEQGYGRDDGVYSTDVYLENALDELVANGKFTKPDRVNLREDNACWGQSAELEQFGRELADRIDGFMIGRDYVMINEDKFKASEFSASSNSVTTWDVSEPCGAPGPAATPRADGPRGRSVGSLTVTHTASHL